ncbi:sulfurtransferase complex subunit TusB [Thalassotalea agarivorans]|uniref:Sulfur relay protein TusB/DsrH n=1 Tax=Thalassotalea agarivorans TaxID=349064 RepID=A0A1I0F1B8_THASX|nr:sulfurtransferase complex subunit TusB [Thalassotalea agarivorans]SET50796.1 sulfur relay protein TusB/DsrH [Thalassotalea agarivorans]
MIHLLRTSPFSGDNIGQLNANISNGDIIVLVDDGVYLLQHESINNLAGITDIYALAPHRVARSVETHAQVKDIDYAAWVALAAQHTSVTY